MTESQLMNLASGAMLMTAKLALPFLLASLAVGLLVSLFQSVTQIQEVTLTFVPKLGVIALIMVVSGHWMLSQMEGYTTQLFNQITALLGG
ncbi:MAG: flagellar biosynthesis protein FliQ [Actinomycetota bacterium]|nr:flagellar biosynthesis protein FliQ [Actinomycetota bacterium]